jgi:hypothetical protein
LKSLFSTGTVMPPKTSQHISPAPRKVRRNASRAAPLHRLCDTRSGAIATTMPSIRSNRPHDWCPSQARNSSRLIGVSGS